MQPVPDDPLAVPSTGPIRPQTVAQCHEVIDTLVRLVTELQQQVAWLQERVKLDSKTSSKPPSSDGPGSGNRAQRRASGRKRGAQKGHAGSFRALLEHEQVDQVVDCPPPAVCECGGAVQLDGELLRHQVFDAPVVQARVSEYRLQAGCCTACGKRHRATLPAGVPSGQIGPRALALVGVLGTRYHLTQGKIRDLLADVVGVDFSVGAISQAHAKVALALKAPLAEVAVALAEAPVVQIDETHYPREGASHWAWGVVTPKLVSYRLLPSRARYVAVHLLGEKPAGWVVSDRYAVYDYVDVAQRQVCWAHLLRDFARIGQRAGLAGRIGRGLLGAGYVLFRWRRQHRSAAQFAPLRCRVRRLLEQGCTQPHCARTARTCANVLRLWPALWTFLDHPAVPPTNNEAERALRALVLKRKISGPTRSRRGDEFIARGFSVYESCRRQGRDLWNYLHDAVVAWIDQTTPPSLLPVVAAAVAAPSG